MKVSDASEKLDIDSRNLLKHVKILIKMPGVINGYIMKKLKLKYNRGG